MTRVYAKSNWRFAFLALFVREPIEKNVTTSLKVERVGPIRSDLPVSLFSLWQMWRTAWRLGGFQMSKRSQTDERVFGQMVLSISADRENGRFPRLGFMTKDSVKNVHKCIWPNGLSTVERAF